MIVKIRKTGNSLALTIPQEISNQLNLKEGNLVDVNVDSGKFVVNKVDVIPALNPEIESIAEKGIERFRHDLDILAKSE